MILAIIGQTLSGKSTLAKEFVSKYEGIELITTYTDRPIRPGEQDGIHYHFKEIGELDSDEFFGHREFFTVYRKEPFTYAMNKDDFAFGDKVIVVDPNGLRVLKDMFGKKVQSVYLNVTEDVLMNRAKQRGDTLAEVKRRLDVDNPLFINAELYCDIVLDENSNADDLYRKVSFD